MSVIVVAVIFIPKIVEIGMYRILFENFRIYFFFEDSESVVTPRTLNDQENEQKHT